MSDRDATTNGEYADLDIERENARRKMWGHHPFGERCDYLGCHTTETVGLLNRWRLCAEHVKPEYHPKQSVVRMDVTTPTSGSSAGDDA